jgi:GcrA cell cycle regulator
MIVQGWTDERMEQLRVLWDRQLSASEIGRILGATRNAVLGKVHRMRLPSHKPVTEPSRTKPKLKRNRNRFVPTRLYDRAPARPLPQLVDVPAQVRPRFVSIMDLKSGDCRWPIGDPRKPTFSFCGDGVRDSSSYCAAHHQLAYRPSQDRRPGKGDVRSAERLGQNQRGPLQAFTLEP